MAKIREPSLTPPAPEIPPQCPICMEETDTFIRDYWGDIVGCDKCCDKVDAWDWRAEHE